MVLENRSSYVLHGMAGFDLLGEGPLFNYIQYQYKDFMVNLDLNIESSRNFNVEIAPIVGDFDFVNTLSVGNESFSRSVENNNFVWSVKNRSALLDGQKPLSQQCTVKFDYLFNKMSANVLCELFLRLKFVRENAALVHAACVEKNGETILLPAWKGMGKTAVCLKLVSEGYNFLADDRLWLRSDGIALSFPRYVVLKDSNFEHFPNMMGTVTKLLFSVFKIISRFRRLGDNNLFKRVRKKIISAKYFYVDELYPGAKKSDQAKVTKVTQLLKCKSCNSIELLSVDPDRTSSIVCDINDVEWNHSLQTLASAHDILFPDAPSWSAELSDLIIHEKRIVKDALSSIDCSVIYLPEEAKKVNWASITGKLSS